MKLLKGKRLTPVSVIALVEWSSHSSMLYWCNESMPVCDFVYPWWKDDAMCVLQSIKWDVTADWFTMICGTLHVIVVQSICGQLCLIASVPIWIPYHVQHTNHDIDEMVSNDPS